MGETIDTAPEQRRAVLVAVVRERQDERQANEYLDELEFLAETAGIRSVKRFTQRLAAPSAKTFIGEGKLAEIAAFVEENEIRYVIFDDELSPSQLRNLDKVFKNKIYDRTSLILDIFVQRATTAYAKAQVELAQCQYLLPRLAGMWTHLERQRGGTGTRGGAGEREIETDRRVIRNRISRLKEQLSKIDRQMAVQRGNRGSLVRVALVGYTNVGKSTLMNLIAKSEVFAENKLFATLDTTVRKVVLENLPFLLSDTVGFIRKLPHQLVEAFKATLEELEYADLLLHVIDVANPEWQHQAEVVEKLIVELGANEIPRIDVFNKCDRVEAGDLRPHGADICSISARTGEGVDRLLEMIDQRLDKGTRRVTIHLPYDKGGLLDMLYREAKVESVEYSETIDIVAVCPPKVLGQIGDYTPDWTPPKEDWE